MTASPRPAAAPDNLLGICHALGGEFAIDPLPLRIAFAAALLWNPAAVVSAYAATGLALVAVRIAVPHRR